VVTGQTAAAVAVLEDLTTGDLLFPQGAFCSAEWMTGASGRTRNPNILAQDISEFITWFNDCPARQHGRDGRRMNHCDRLARFDQERQHVQEAARRLLAGTARASSGTPAVTSLARESGINRTSLYQRHPGLIAEFKAAAGNAADTPAAQALQGQLDAARTRITSLEQENAALCGRVRALIALVVEMNLEADGKTNVIPLKR
jgi:hypothetical protein